MKKLFVSFLFVIFTGSVFAQPVFDLGLKGGVNFSKMYLDLEDYSSESITKSHMGAFARIGWNRVFIQPEVYFSGKGGDVTSSIFSTISSFDYKSVDVPVLLGIKLIKGKVFSLHGVAGPVFSGITTEDISGDNTLNKSFYESHYFGLQYGLGADVLFMSLDARFEQGLGDMYQQPSFNASNRTFMVSLGFRIF